MTTYFKYENKEYPWYDWIAPKENLWDSSGLKLIPNNGYSPSVNFNKSSSLFSMIGIYIHKIGNLLYKYPNELEIKTKLENETHNCLLINSLRIAEYRYKQGLPPKFWVSSSKLEWNPKLQKMIVS